MTLLLGSMLVLIAMGIPVAFAIAVSGVTYRSEEHTSNSITS